jgi:hypothetical protein
MNTAAVFAAAAAAGAATGAAITAAVFRAERAEYTTRAYQDGFLAADRQHRRSVRVRTAADARAVHPTAYPFPSSN